MVITTWKVGSQVDLAAFRVFKKYLRILLYYGGNFPSGSTAQWNGIADCYIFSPQWYEFESRNVSYFKHSFSIYFGLERFYVTSFFQLHSKNEWDCNVFDILLNNKSKRQSQGQLRVWSRFPTSGVATTTSEAFGWKSPVKPVTTWTETPGRPKRGGLARPSNIDCMNHFPLVFWYSTWFSVEHRLWTLFKVFVLKTYSNILFALLRILGTQAVFPSLNQ